MISRDQAGLSGPPAESSDSKPVDPHQTEHIETPAEQDDNVLIKLLRNGQRLRKERR